MGKRYKPIQMSLNDCIFNENINSQNIYLKQGHGVVCCVEATGNDNSSIKATNVKDRNCDYLFPTQQQRAKYSQSQNVDTNASQTQNENL